MRKRKDREGWQVGWSITASGQRSRKFKLFERRELAESFADELAEQLREQQRQAAEMEARIAKRRALAAQPLESLLNQVVDAMGERTAGGWDAIAQDVRRIGQDNAQGRREKNAEEISLVLDRILPADFDADAREALALRLYGVDSKSSAEALRALWQRVEVRRRRQYEMEAPLRAQKEAEESARRAEEERQAQERKLEMDRLAAEDARARQAGLGPDGRPNWTKLDDDQLGNFIEATAPDSDVDAAVRAFPLLAQAQNWQDWHNAAQTEMMRRVRADDAASAGEDLRAVMQGGGMRIPYHPGMAYWGEVSGLRENTERRDFSRLWRKAEKGEQANREFEKLREKLVENGFTQYDSQEGGAALLTDLQRMLRGERVMPDYQVQEETASYGENSRGDAEAERELYNVQPTTLEKAYAAIKELAGKPLKNLETGIVGRINRVQRDKLTSAAAQTKSQDNGFSAEQHLGAAAKVEQLWRHATLVEDRPDNSGDKNISSIKRFAAPLFIGNAPAVAWLTAKESTEAGHRVYSIELQEIEMLRGNLKALAESNGQRLPARSIAKRINKLFGKVKPDFNVEETQALLGLDVPAGVDLPREIRNLTPRWQSGRLDFSSSLDKGLYYAGAEGNTELRDRITASLMQQTGLSRGQVLSLARDLREKIRRLVVATAPNGLVRLPPLMRGEARAMMGADSPLLAEGVQTELEFPASANQPITDPVERTQWEAGQEGRAAIASQIEDLADDPAALNSYDKPAEEVGRNVGRVLREKGSVTSIIADLAGGVKNAAQLIGLKMHRPADLASALWWLRDPFQERMGVAVLAEDGKTVIAAEVLTVGTINSSLADPKLAARLIAQAGPRAKYYVLFHNHPSGIPNPSRADMVVTNNFRSATMPNGAQLLDHIVTNGDRFYSFANAGMTDTGSTEAMPASTPRPEWEAVQREHLLQLNNSEQSAQVLNGIYDMVRPTNPDTTIFLYLSTQLHLIGAEVVPAGLDGAALAERMVTGAARQGAHGVMIGMPARWAEDGKSLREMRALRQTAEIAKIGMPDVMLGRGAPQSLMLMGLMERQTAYGEDERSSGNTVRESPAGYGADRAAQLRERIAEIDRQIAEWRELEDQGTGFTGAQRAQMEQVRARREVLQRELAQAENAERALEQVTMGSALEASDPVPDQQQQPTTAEGMARKVIETEGAWQPDVFALDELTTPQLETFIQTLRGEFETARKGGLYRVALMEASDVARTLRDERNSRAYQIRQLQDLSICSPKLFPMAHFLMGVSRRFQNLVRQQLL